MYILYEVFEDYLHSSVPRYTATMHCLLIHNYNNVSNEIAPFHISAGIPKYIPNLHY